MSELVSIIIPTKNAANHLRILFSSLLKQTYKNFEVVVNDDEHTSDNTSNVINAFKKRLKIVYVRKNYSMAQGRKYGGKVSKGKYQLHLDADMKLSSHVLEKCVLACQKGCDAVVVREVSFGQGFWSRARAFERSLYYGDSTVESARFFKTSVYWAVGGHNEHMVLSEDKDLDLRVRAAGYKVCHVSAPIYHNEGKLDLRKDFRKKFFYGRTARIFIDAHPGQSLVQANLIFRPAYFRNWKKLVANPVLAIGMFVMKFVEALAALLGLLSTKVPLGNTDPWK